ncbi:Putative AC transposase [Dendrobium catenatum]|uniref:AC transposase n=1 Tax=Dendrobium catenatum TaxID=906689 RepID=A0A2I0WGJ9_9ASPA|nr:Putative AC transposase [Dendrobium catenatum]
MPRKSELEMYLDEPKLDKNSELDILQYWKINQFRFPRVSRMAVDVLCILISIVASKFTFSNGGRLLDQYRSVLKHDIVEALVCTKDWLYNDQGNLFVNYHTTHYTSTRMVKFLLKFIFQLNCCFVNIYIYI